MRQDKWTGHSKQSGYVLVTVAMLLVVLLGFSALAIDVGMLYSARTQSQRAADEAALAGAFTYIVANLDAATAKTKAEFDAVGVATNNKVMGQTVSAAQVTAVADPANRRVTVTISRNEPTFLAKALGTDSALVSVTAVAEASPYSTSFKCGKPWFMPNTLAATTETPCDACANNHILIDPATRQLTQYGKDFIQSTANKTGFNVRTKNSDASLGSGDSLEVQLANNSGNDIRAAIGTCSDLSYVCNNSYQALNGVKQGPIVQGVTDLVGGNGSI